MKITCPSCSVHISIDQKVLAALAGKTHFACPSCQATVCVPGRTPSLATAHRGLNRNMLILGSAALLVLGGLGFFLASHKSGDTTNTSVQNIHNDIFNNSYFTQLIGTGATTREYLEAISDIRPYEGGFIGISAEPFDWTQAIEIANRTGSVVLDSGVADNGDQKKLLSWIQATFSKDISMPLWMDQKAKPSVFLSTEVLAVTSINSKRRVLLHWKPTMLAKEPLPWVVPTIPKPDADGWITLFDGSNLYASSPENSEKIKIEDGCLSVDSSWVRFNFIARNVAIRTQVKRLSASDIVLGCRAGILDRKVEAWLETKYSKGGRFSIGSVIDSKWEIVNKDAPVDYNDFFKFELIAMENKITAFANDQEVNSAVISEVEKAGSFGVQSLFGISLFRSIQVKILDE